MGIQSKASIQPATGQTEESAVKGIKSERYKDSEREKMVGGMILRFFLAAATLPFSSPAPVDFLAPQTLPAGCRLEVITVQEEVEETKVEKVVCETGFRPTCNIKLEKDCKNVTRPACQVEEKMECVQSTVSQCSTETRIGSTGEEEQVEVCREIPIEDCQLVKEEKCIDGELEEVEECDEKEVEECEIVPHEECHQVTVDLPRLQDKQVQQIVCDEENEIEDSVTTENVASDVSAEENVLENNFDEILDAVNTIFGSGSPEEVAEGEDEVSVSNDDVTTTEAEPLATEESVQTTTILPSEPITTTTPTTTTTTSTTTPPTTSTTTTEAATTTQSTSTTATDATTFESSSPESTDEIDTEAIFVSSTVAPTEPRTDDSKIHFRDNGVVRDFTKRIFVDDGLVDARRKAILARRKAEADASRIFFPSEEEGGASIPS